MATGTLYTYPGNFRAYKALIAANYSKSKIKVVSQPPDFVIGETNQSPQFLEKFPVGKVPAFETNKGETIFESAAIAWYLSNNQLRGNSSAEDSAHVLQWLSFAENEISPSACAWVFPSLGIMQMNKQSVEQAKVQVKKVMEVLDQFLKSRTYLVTERITLADISVACALLPLYQNIFDPAYRKPYVNVNRWFTTLINQPEFKSVIADVKLCEKMLPPFDAKKYNELHGSGDVKKDGGKKKEKQATPQKPKQEKKEKPAKEAEEEPDASEQALAAEPKQKDPFEPYPKGSFNMDEFKRTYSNEETIEVAIPYFWKNFDKENYSVWYCEYKFPKELTMVFMSCNLIGGMFQRLDKLRKNAFASMILFGSDNNSTISGVWIWRGHDLAFTLSPDWQIDYESYEWKKLDANDEKTKTLVDEYFAWEGNFDGKKFNQGKIFK